MPSPICLVNDAPTTNGVDASPRQSRYIKLADSTDVFKWSIYCISTDDLNDVDAVNAYFAQPENPSDEILIFTPDTARGSALIFKSTVNNGYDLNGVYHPEYVTTFGIFAIPDGKVRLIALDQTTEGDSVYGWVSSLNQMLSNDIAIVYDGSDDITKTTTASCGSISTTDSTLTNVIEGGIVFHAREIISGTDDYIDTVDGYDTAIITRKIVDTNTINIHLPAPSLGRMLIVSKSYYDQPAITYVVPYSSEKINGVAGNLELNTLYSGCTLISDGTDWFCTHAH